MTSGTRLVGQTNNSVLALHELTIVLFPGDSFAGLINPDFLRYNGVAEDDWNIERPVILQSGYAYVGYDNGLSFTANDSFLTVTQRSTPHGPGEIVCHQAMGRLLEVAPPTVFDTVGIDPAGFINITDEHRTGKWSPLRRLGLQMSSGEVTPDVQARVEYEFPGKDVTIYIIESAAGGPDGTRRLDFRGQVHREVTGETRQEQDQFIRSILDGWERDVKDFQDLALRFHSLFLTEEHHNAD